MVKNKLPSFVFMIQSVSQRLAYAPPVALTTDGSVLPVGVQAIPLAFLGPSNCLHITYCHHLPLSPAATGRFSRCAGAKMIFCVLGIPTLCSLHMPPSLSLSAPPICPSTHLLVFLYQFPRSSLLSPLQQTHFKPDLLHNIISQGCTLAWAC